MSPGALWVAGEAQSIPVAQDLPASVCEGLRRWPVEQQDVCGGAGRRALWSRGDK